MKFCLSVTFTLLFCVLPSSPASDSGYPRPQLLIEPMELAQGLGDAAFVILDVRGEEDYAKAHVPGARRIDHDAWKKAFGDGQDVESWAKRIGQLGIAADSTVVLYDDKAMKGASRIWWILRYWGIDDARLLNGSWRGWITARLPTTQELPSPKEPVEFRAKPHAERLATKQRILDSLQSKTCTLIDTRSEAEFVGNELRENRRGGTIPTSKHLEWSNLIDQETHRFKSADEVRGLLEAAAIQIDRPIVTHCQSGGRASAVAFGLELMGAEDVRNYYNSWAEWGNADDTPIVKP